MKYQIMANQIPSATCSRLISRCLLLPLLVLVSSPSLGAAASASNHVASLARGSHLSVEKRDSSTLLSPDGTFSCGFHQIGTNAFSFSIWYTAGTPTTVVWSANRDRPINGRRSTMTLGKNGVLYLTDGTDGSVVWRSNGSAVGYTSADRAELLDSGNLVLRDPAGDVVWQSFDFPTDTLLPGQPLTKDVRVVSSVRTGSLASGYYVLYFDNDNVVRLMYDSPEITTIYWPNPDNRVWDNKRTSYNSTRYAVLDDSGSFVSSDNLSVTALDHNLPPQLVRRRLTLDPDGNIRVYSRRSDLINGSAGGWYVSWQARSNRCKTHGLCGKNGICAANPEPRCSCPVGYEMANPTNWKDGCNPMFDPSTLCKKEARKPFQYVPLPHTDCYGSEINFTLGISLELCKQICDENCACHAFIYRSKGDGFCYQKAALFNGYTDPIYPATMYIKLPGDFKINGTSASKSNPLYPNLIAHELDCSRASTNVSSSSVLVPQSGYGTRGGGGGKRTGSLRLAYGYGFAAVFGFVELLFIFTGWWFLYRNIGPHPIWPEEEGYQTLSSQFRKFGYGELKKATNNFKEVLGRGGSGDVYKGVLQDKRVVAVKKLVDTQGQGDEEFRAELGMIGKINHMNLVRMWGFCLQPSRRLLVYEFVENGSLAKALFLSGDDNAGQMLPRVDNGKVHDSRADSSNPTCPLQPAILDWDKRVSIALGMARGLAYLHHECLEWIIHCDIKPENILLDSEFQPKIADFGLAKLTQRGGQGSYLSKIRGTKGYMAPEWTSSVPITAKVDVFSFGVILLELVRGVRHSSWDVPDSHQSDGMKLEIRCLVTLIKGRLGGNEESGFSIVEQLVDPRLYGQFDRVQALVLLKVAVSCLEEDRNKRPTMDTIVHTLLNI